MRPGPKSNPGSKRVGGAAQTSATTPTCTARHDFPPDTFGATANDVSLSRRGKRRLCQTSDVDYRGLQAVGEGDPEGLQGLHPKRATAREDYAPKGGITPRTSDGRGRIRGGLRGLHRPSGSASTSDLNGDLTTDPPGGPPLPVLVQKAVCQWQVARWHWWCMWGLRSQTPPGGMFVTVPMHLA